MVPSQSLKNLHLISQAAFPGGFSFAPKKRHAKTDSVDSLRASFLYAGMQNTVYRASRLSILYAMYLVACAVQVWNPPVVHYHLTCCAFATGAPAAIGPALIGLFKFFHHALFGYATLAMLLLDGIYEYRKRPLCFPVTSAAKEGVSVCLAVGVVGVLVMMVAQRLDTYVPLHGSTLTVLTPSLLHKLTGSSSWATVGLLCKSLGLLGVAGVFCFGRRPPGR